MKNNTGLPLALYSASQVRELDRLAIEQYGTPGIDLMNRAGRFTFRMLHKHYPEIKNLCVLCGSGNNAGDGYIIAGLARLRGYEVTVLHCSNPSKLKGDAQIAYQFAIDNKVKVQAFSAEHWQLEMATLSSDQIVFVDALLGTGLSGDIRENYQAAITCLNQQPAQVIAVDIPSGLSADTGQVMGMAVEADITATYIGLKQGLFTGEAACYCGKIVFDDLGVPEKVYSHIQPNAKRLCLNSLVSAFPKRAANAHKGSFGHVLIVGGDQGFGGAVMMAAEAAARVGAGLTTVATHPDHIGAMLTRRPEVMVRGISNSGIVHPEALDDLLEAASVIVIGPGLGKSDWSKCLLQQVLKSTRPMVVDADALNLLALFEKESATSHKRDNWILTPHPGEAARLLGFTTEDIQKNRFEAVLALQEKWGGEVILKGSGTLIAHASGSEISLCDRGNPGMASGGMGDVLSGILGSLVAQHLMLDLAAKLGVCVHAESADVAVKENGQKGLLATDLIPYVRRLLNKFTVS